MSVLEARSISVARGGRPILQGISLQLLPGEFQAIIGPNGSGKSTLLRALGGIWPVTSGDVLLDGKSIPGFPRRTLARRIALVPQETNMDWAFTVEEIVAMGRHPHRGRFANETNADREAIRLALEQCDITSLRNRLVNTLSGGERQRVLIARSLAVQPEFILLDEPTASLDVQHVIDILELCKTLTRSGHTIALSTHDLNAVSRYASSVALLEAGRLVGSGPRDEVLKPQYLQQVFGVRPEMLSTADGHPVYVFHRKDSSIQ